MSKIFALYLEKADECLTDAVTLLENQRFSAAVSRSYYAMFYAAQAALYKENIDAYTHTGVNIQFQKAFIKTGRFPLSFGKTFSKIADQRLKSDYEIGFKATHNEAQHTFDEAKEFVSTIRNFITM
jgi:uncharacterized protein (UPF0332 family)